MTYDALGLPIAAWVVEENARPGTKAWLVSGSPPHGLEGFADRVSAQHGDEVTLFVNTVAGSVEVDAYRLGWYGGYGARSWPIWEEPGASSSPCPRPRRR